MVAVEGMLMAAEAESDEAGRREATAAATEADLPLQATPNASSWWPRGPHPR